MIFGYAPAMCRVLVAALVVFGCGFEHGARTADSDTNTTEEWWDTAWHARIKLSIAPATPLPLGFQIGVPLDLDAAPCRGGRDDVRVIIGRTELARVIDDTSSGAGNELVWFKLAGALSVGTVAEDYYIYCDNANATKPATTESDVFDYYDGFDGTVLDSSWQVLFGTPAVANGSLMLAPATTGIATIETFGPNTAVDFRAKSSVGAMAMPSFWAGFSSGSSFTLPWIRWAGGNGANQIRATVGDTSVTDSASPRTLDTNTHVYGVEHAAPRDATFRIDHVAVDALSYGGSFTMPPLSVALVNYQSNGPIDIDWVRVRETVKPVPTVSLGMPEQR